jgi:putative nucleotidyltransferase with HDIG domain
MILPHSEKRLFQDEATAAAHIRTSEVISALSFALDLTGGQPPGHSVRSCVFGMHVAAEMNLPLDAQGDLYYALLMKDAGCSSNASLMHRILGTDDRAGKRDALRIDWTRTGWESLQYALSHVKTGAPFLERIRALFDMAKNQKQNAKALHQIRCERGSAIARRIGLSEQTASAIHCLNEHWNGMGEPEGLRGEEIPLLSRIMNVAQTADIFCSAYGNDGPAQAVAVVRKRSGFWFDPDVANAFCSVAVKQSLWLDVENAAQRVIGLEPRADILSADEASIDNICLAFADVIDAKSPFTYRHSTGVADAAVSIARMLSMGESDVTLIRRAALLHDIGKLSVSNTILDKPGSLTGDEWQVVRKHPQYSLEILRRIPSFHHLSEVAASHHEKLDGSGYFRNMSADQLSLPARILTVADVYDGLSAKRPYRDALPLEHVLAIMRKDAPRALDADCFEALKYCSDSASSATGDLTRLSLNVQANAQAERPVLTQ